jgi:hypothetical protein
MRKKGENESSAIQSTQRICLAVSDTNISKPLDK